MAVRSLLEAATAKCLHCNISISVADMESENSSLKRILRVLRSLSDSREMYRQRQEQTEVLNNTDQILEKSY